MIEWFKNDVENSSAKWKIVYQHRPQYNLGGHRSNWGNVTWRKLFRDYKIDVVFSGHSHLYERFYPMRPAADEKSWPVTYITTGGAGAELYDTVKNEYTVVAQSVNHYMLVRVLGDTLHITAKLLGGGVLDDFRMIKQNGLYNEEYLQTVKPQETMDIYMAFAGPLRCYFRTIPTDTQAAVTHITFDGKGFPVDVPFRLVLADESLPRYRLEPVESVLKKDQKYEGEVSVYAKGKIKLDGRYFDPPMIFNVVFTYNGKNILVKGRRNRYASPKKK